MRRTPFQPRRVARPTAFRRLFLEPLEERRLLAGIHPFDLSTLDGSNGFRLDGIDTGDQSGLALHTAGDVNGDGFDDLIIGAYGGDPDGRTDAGETYIVFGKMADWSASFDLATLDGTNGFRIDGIDASDISGWAVRTAGDVNADGYADLLIGARYAEAKAGESYIVFGSNSGFSASLSLSTLDGTNGFRLDGIDANDQSGLWLDSAGDVNGDGYADIIIGARYADAGGDVDSGEAYVVFGKAVGFAAAMDLATLNGNNGFRLDGIDPGDHAGVRVGSVGDVNGDGFDEFYVGSTWADPGGKSQAGETYVIYGKPSDFAAATSLSTLDGSTGFRIDGLSSGDKLTIWDSAGDVNGDGFDDILMTARWGDPGGRGNAGETYVVFGKSGSFGASFDLASLDGTNGYRIDGIDAGDLAAGQSTAGDVNGDGFDDILIGANADGGIADPGETYVVFGKSSGYTATFQLSSLNGTNGFRLDGIDSEARDAGDVNGDGYSDIIIGARAGDAGGTPNAGQSFLVFGGDFTDSVTHAGTSADDTLTGDTSANVIIAGQGDDILDGKGGADVLYGAEGDDVLRISDMTFARVDGGRGTDTLALDGSGLTLDLTTIADNKLRGIEQIDITGNGDNTLILNKLEVLNLSDTSNTLVVISDSGDTIQIGDGWITDGFETINGVVYTVYKQGAATVKLQASFDFGDAPMPYSVMLAEDGARHVVAGPTLGTQRDGEFDGTHSSDATGDDINGTPDDEDGVTFGSIRVGQLDATATVNVQNAPEDAKLDAWIDLNGDGAWSGAFEHVANNLSVSSGDNLITFDIPTTAAAGTTYARFRISTEGNLGVGGMTSDGEVEDYQLNITGPTASSGDFTAQNIITNEANEAWGVATADLNGDGYMDIVSASRLDNKIAWYENDGNQGFTSHTITTTQNEAETVFTADVDGDGDIDILSASQSGDKVEWYENEGSGTFATHLISNTMDGALDVHAADIDHDGDMDVFATSWRENDGVGKLSWFENDGHQNFTEHIIGNRTRRILVLDIDNDGDSDILAGGKAAPHIRWHENDGNQNFAVHIISTEAPFTVGMSTGDLDGDGDVDLVTASTGDHEISWYENDGDGNFRILSVGTEIDPTSAYLSDIDGDGDLDIVATVSGTSHTLLYTNDGKSNPTFTRKVITELTAGARVAITADMNNDGYLDILTASADDNKIAWYMQLPFAPTIDAIADVIISEDASEQIVNLTGISAGGGELQPLKVTAVSSDTSLIPNPTVTYASPDSTGTLKFTPVTDQTGTATITVTVEDGGLDNNLDTPEDNATFSRTFEIEVRIEFPWSNPRNVLDVNDDGFVSPIDAFIVISDLNVNGARELPVPPVAPNAPPPYLDPSGDNSISPIDAFMIVSFLSGSGSGEGEYFGPVDHSNSLAGHEYPHQWNSESTRDLDLRPVYEVGRWWSDTDAPYTEQPIGFAVLDNRDLQITRMMASVSNWRESVWEDLLDEIAEDVSQLDNDDFHAGFERTAATRRSK